MAQPALSWWKRLTVIGSGSSVDNEVSGGRTVRHRTRRCMKGKSEALIVPNLLAALGVPVKRMLACWMGYFYASASSIAVGSSVTFLGCTFSPLIVYKLELDCCAVAFYRLAVILVQIVQFV